MIDTSYPALSAEQLLSSIYCSTSSIKLPINVIEIAESLGIKVSKVQFSNPEISGAFYKPEKKILVSKDKRLENMLFTVAHELGHYVLEDLDNSQETSESDFSDIVYHKQVINFSNASDNREKKCKSLCFVSFNA